MFKLFIILSALLLLAGCTGGAGSALFSSLFSVGSTLFGSPASLITAAATAGSSAAAIETGESFIMASGFEASAAGGMVLAHTPEPSSLILLGIGLAGLVVRSRKIRKR